jgi:hypothetical protein
MTFSTDSTLRLIGSRFFRRSGGAVLGTNIWKKGADQKGNSASSKYLPPFFEAKYSERTFDNPCTDK